MATHLFAFLTGSHGGFTPAGAPMRLRADDVVLDEHEGTLALLAFEALRVERVSCELALIAPEHEGIGPDAREDVRYLQQAAARFGARFARPGAAPAALLHRRRFAAPGRVLASAAPGAGGCGAFGMLHLQASALECAGALASEPLLRIRPPVIGVELKGRLAPGATGIDVLETLARRLEGATHGAWLEFVGSGVASLPMVDRVVVAAHAKARLAAMGAVFPVDEVVRVHLRARGREADWRRLEGGGEGFEQRLLLDLAQVLPGAGASVGLRLARARVGPLAEDDELRRLARVLEQHPVQAGVMLEVVLAGRAQQAALTADGTLARLEGRGARSLDRAAPQAAAAAGEALVCGCDPEHPGEDARVVSVWTVAALACFGEVRDIAEIASQDPEDANEPLTGGELFEGELIDAPAHQDPLVHGAAHRVPETPPPFDHPRRGVVIAVSLTV